MIGTLGIIQARMGSTRLRAKLARRLGGKSLLEWVVRRVTDAGRLDGVVVAAGSGSDAERLAELVPANVPIVFGSEHDVLSRFLTVLDAYPARAVVRVCADNPFIDPELIDRLVATATEQAAGDYLGYASHNGRPMILSSVGLFAEWCQASALRRAAAESTDPADREHVTRYIYSHPDRFQVRLLPAPSALDRDDLRLTVDLEEDWEHTETIFDALGQERLVWQDIASLLAHQPLLRRRMAVLNRTHAKAS